MNFFDDDFGKREHQSDRCIYFVARPVDVEEEARLVPRFALSIPSRRSSRVERMVPTLFAPRDFGKYFSNPLASLVKTVLINQLREKQV